MHAPPYRRLVAAPSTVVLTLLLALAIAIGLAGPAPAFAADPRVWSLKAVPIAPQEGVPFSGPIACIELHAGSFTDDDWNATVDWGDGTPTTTAQIGGDGVCSIGYSVEGTHTYALPGVYTLRLRVDDLKETGAFATITREITVGMLPNDLSVSLAAAPNPVRTGTNLLYTITVTNGSASVASDVVLTDTLPAGAQFLTLSKPAGTSCQTPPVGSTGTAVCQLGTLTANQVVTVTIKAKVVASGGSTVENKATVVADDPELFAQNNTATVATSVYGRR